MLGHSPGGAGPSALVGTGGGVVTIGPTPTPGAVATIERCQELPLPFIEHRTGAGKLLGDRLVDSPYVDPVVLALPRGGVPVGYQVARTIGAPLDVIVVRKLGRQLGQGRVLEGILKADLILIDEIGFAPMDHTGAQLFFRLVAAAYERRSLGVGLALALRGLGTLPARPLDRRQPARPTASTTTSSWSPKVSPSA